jgi:thiamine-phosphate pyrophosphorylase
MQKLLKLCLITNRKNQTIPEYISFVENAIYGGVTMLQLRDKFSDYDALKEFAISLQKILRPFDIPLIINDNVDLALDINASGVHVGNDDMKAKEARKILGAGKIIGISIESLQDLKNANKLVGKYYVAASAVFSSNTKLNCKKIWGLEGLKFIVENSNHPVVAIGNINQANIKGVLDLGVKGVAVVSAIHNYPAKNAAFKLKQIIEEKLCCLK